MKMEGNSQILDKIRFICKEIINKEFSEEIEYFDAIWEVMKEFIAKWNENIPEELVFEEYQKGLEKELGFLDPSRGYLHSINLVLLGCLKVQ